MARVVALVGDGALEAALAAAAVAAGHEFVACAGEAEAWAACEPETGLLVIDASTDATDGVTLVDSMRAGGELVGVRTLAIHEDADAAARAGAHAVGFDVVVPSSRAEADAARLLAGLLA